MCFRGKCAAIYRECREFFGMGNKFVYDGDAKLILTKRLESDRISKDVMLRDRTICVTVTYTCRVEFASPDYVAHVNTLFRRYTAIILPYQLALVKTLCPEIANLT